MLATASHCPLPVPLAFFLLPSLNPLRLGYVAGADGGYPKVCPVGIGKTELYTQSIGVLNLWLTHRLSHDLSKCFERGEVSPVPYCQPIEYFRFCWKSFPL